MFLVYFVNGIWNSKYKNLISIAIMGSFLVLCLFGSGWWQENELISAKISSAFVGMFGIGIMTMIVIFFESLLTMLCQQVIK